VEIFFLKDRKMWR